MNYDLAIIGAGWAGFNAALRAKELGLSVVLIEKGPIGGTCLNQGCIPTKALIHSAKIYSLAKKSRVFGVENCDPKIDFGAIQARKDSIVGQLQQGMQAMLKGIDLVRAAAHFLSDKEIATDDGTIRATHFIIASGSRPYELPNLGFDNQKVLSSDQVLQIKNIPSSIMIIGGGVIGCEFASLFNVLGSKVTVVEKLSCLLPEVDSEAAKRMAVIFKKKGIDVRTQTDASTVDISDYDQVLVAVGRKANVEDLGLEKAGIKVEQGRIAIDESLKTSAPNIYACGDCASKLMLAHYASYQGRLAVENIAGTSDRKTDARSIPNCIFTDPQIGAVGLSEDQAASAGREVNVDRIFFLANGMARIIDETEGFIKVISDKKSGEVLGSVVLGPLAAELIAPLTLAVSCRLKASSIRDTVFAHPTLSESLSEVIKFR